MLKLILMYLMLPKGAYYLPKKKTFILINDPAINRFQISNNYKYVTTWETIKFGTLTWNKSLPCGGYYAHRKSFGEKIPAKKYIIQQIKSAL